MLRDRPRPTALLALLAAAIAGCNREAGAPANGARPGTPGEPPAPSGEVLAPTTRPPPDPGSSAAPTAPTAASTAPRTPEEPERPYVLVELAPTQGDLLPLLREHAARAREKKLRPFAEFYADWCAPCRELTRSMGDPRVIDAFRSTYIVKINFDDWQDKLPGTGFVPRQIPVFYAVGADGRPAGPKLV